MTTFVIFQSQRIQRCFTSALCLWCAFFLWRHGRFSIYENSSNQRSSYSWIYLHVQWSKQVLTKWAMFLRYIKIVHYNSSTSQTAKQFYDMHTNKSVIDLITRWQGKRGHINIRTSPHWYENCKWTPLCRIIDDSTIHQLIPHSFFPHHGMQPNFVNGWI